MLARITERPGPGPIAPVLGAGALYAPGGLLFALDFVAPIDAAPGKSLRLGIWIYLLFVYFGSTAWISRRASSTIGRARVVGAAGVVGVACSLIVGFAAEAMRFERFLRWPPGFHIEECFACEAPWDAAARFAILGLTLVPLGMLASPLLGWITRPPTPPTLRGAEPD